MRGSGTTLETIKNNAPPARLLDITRLISRAGRVPTGIDRVELAYLSHLGKQSIPLYAIARTTLGYVLLGPEGVSAIRRKLEGTLPWGKPDGWSALTRKKNRDVRMAESDLRRNRLARCTEGRLSVMLSHHVPRGTAYFNTGHSNIRGSTFAAIRQGLGGRIAVLMHDTIPLDHPELQRPGMTARFRSMLRLVREQADLVIYNSDFTERRCVHHMRQWGAPPKGVVVRLGVVPVIPDRDALPACLVNIRPYFVALGTIEARKRHDFLLDLWEDLARDMGTEAPMLVVCGTRGWHNQALFDRLDRLPRNGLVREIHGLPDSAVSALLAASCGLLAPSVAEGFGLPPVEAAALGVPIVCNTLEVYREILGDIPIYVEETDRYQWIKAVKGLAIDPAASRKARVVEAFVPPGWDEHFNTVLSLT